MPLTLGLGGECGDEAKGKGICYLGPEHDIATKTTGSNNAGNKIVWKGEGVKFSQIPTAAIHAHIEAVLGSGMQLNMEALNDEIQRIDAASDAPITPRLHIAPEAHILSKAHIAMDIKMEGERDVPVGTTKKGVGPAVIGKSARMNMRMADLQGTESDLKDRYQKFLGDMNRTFGIRLDSTTEDQDLSAIVDAREKLGGRVLKDTTAYWMDNIHKRILLAGSQGFELSIDGSGYPNVTSNNVTAHGHLAASNGLTAADVTQHIEFIKAYSTRVGGGERWTPMPPDIAAHVQKKGNEFGTQTFRARDAFWQSIVRLRRMLFVNRVSNEHPAEFAMMKVDVLDELDEILVETEKHSVTGAPVYTSLPGWQQSTAGITKWEDLPENTQDYVRFFERNLNTPVSIIGTGAEHESIIDRRKRRSK